ncbi:MAG: methyltransferase domain-containing protein [Verrucomicrobia bacterium]|nr:methyltransferase domain-containing protein [Verrucomicrobiota bacterium]
MRKDHLRYLACPGCKGDLTLAAVEQGDAESIQSGLLVCERCPAEYRIVNHIPRFVPLENYASGFGYEWTMHARTQYDSYSGRNISEQRFFKETQWPRDLAGRSILEVGSGSGRFTEQAASTGAMVVSVDYSYAVEANYASNGAKPNVLIVQGDVYSLPVRKNSFDYLFCFGMLQHTPDVKKAFMELPKYLKKGGRLAVDVYIKTTSLKRFLPSYYWARPLTKHVQPDRLYKIVRRYVTIMWPLAKLINKLPKGRMINRMLLIADYRGRFDLGEEMLKEWAILDTFDGLSPAYDNPQTLETMQQWFQEAGLSQCEVHFGFNGIEGRGIR